MCVDIVVKKWLKLTCLVFSLTVIYLSILHNEVQAEEHISVQYPDMPFLEDWSELPASVLENKKVLVLLVDQSNCPFCLLVKEDFLQPLSISKDNRHKVSIMRISIDSGEFLKGPNGERLSTSVFVGKYDAKFAPTVLFLDGKGQSIAEKIIGINDTNFYWYYLEKSINTAFSVLN